MNNRRLYNRVEEPLANRLRVVSLALLELRVDGRASRIYINEISEAIDQGLLLAATELATTLLEIWVRDLLVVRKITKSKIKSRGELDYLLTKIDLETEGISRGLMFPAMCGELLELNGITQDELEWLQTIYKKTRTPLHHGISGRIVGSNEIDKDFIDNASSKEEMLLATVFCSPPHRRANDFEDFIYESSVEILEGIVNFLGTHQIPSFSKHPIT